MKKAIYRSVAAIGLAGITAIGSGCMNDMKGGKTEIHNPDIGGGRILFYTTAGEYKGSANVGNLPDMVSFTPSGDMLVSANEGEPSDDYSSDPEGSISIITVDKGADELVQDVTTLGFLGVDIGEGVRIKPGSTPVQDLEPEYVAVSKDGKTAWVTLQENNAVAVVDITNNLFC